MNSIVTKKQKWFLILLIIGLGIARTFNEALFERMDALFFGLFVLLVLVFVEAWKNIQSFKWVDVEIELNQAQVKAAVESIKPDLIAQEELRQLIKGLNHWIVKSKDSRILWIDDEPYNIVGIRRLFRAIGLEVITTIDEESAMRKINEDNDFDLIISDIQWRTDTYGGYNMVKKIRGKTDDDGNPDPILSNIPVIFYTAHSKENLLEIHQQIEIYDYTNSHICGDIETLLITSLKTLSQLREHPIEVKLEKECT